MPELTGLEFREQMLKKDLDLPFVIFTAFYNKEMAHEGMKLQVREYLEKPLDATALIGTFSKYIDEKLELIQQEQSMVAEFVSETEPMLEEIEDLILLLEENSYDENAINTYFRLLHTIKGTSSCLGLNDIAGFAHNYENLISRVKSREMDVTPAVTDVLLKGYDYLKLLFECEVEMKQFPHNLEEIAKIFDVKENADDGIVEYKVDASDDKTTNLPIEQKTNQKEDKITINVDVLAEFLELSGEMTVLKNTIFKLLTKLSHKFVGNNDLEQLTLCMSEMHKISSLLQNQVSEMKKISVDNVFKTMKRVVRDSAKVCSKEVKFETIGGQIRIDLSVGKLLNNILVHMLRNSVDHGVETPAIRQEKGKDPQGNISLSCIEMGENIIIEIQDDGAGINVAKIKEKALEKELYTQAQLESMPDARAYHILFESGFSTAEQITSISGRGVGMDMVRSSIEEFGGKIVIDSEYGQGTTFVINIPIPRSVLIIKSLMISSMERKFSVPLDDVDKVLYYEDVNEGEMIYDVEGESFLNHHGDIVPLLNLKAVLTQKKCDLAHDYKIVIVSSEDYRYGLIVDEIEDIEEIVVKKLAHPVNRNPFFLGTTFIGDGEIGLILDLKGIAVEYKLFSDNKEMRDYEIEKAKNDLIVDEEEYMQFDLIENDNFCIPLEYVFRLEKVDAKKIEFSAENPFIRYREGSLPLISLETELDMLDFNLDEYLKENEELDVLVVKVQSQLYGIFIHAIKDIGKTDDKVDLLLKDKRGIEGTLFIDEHINTLLNLDKIIANKYKFSLPNDEGEVDHDMAHIESAKQAS